MQRAMTHPSRALNLDIKQSFFMPKSDIYIYIYYTYIHACFTEYGYLLYGKLCERARCSEFCVLIGYPSGQDGPILPARDCQFCPRKKGLAQVQAGAGEFLWPNIFHDSKMIFCDFSVGMELENEKTETVNENVNKGNKNVDEFQEHILQEKLANAKVKTQSDMKAWNVIQYILY